VNSVHEFVGITINSATTSVCMKSNNVIKYSIMKRFLKIFSIVIAFIIVLLLVLPLLFKGKIEQKVKEEINKTVNATVDYSDFSLSLIRHFPNLSVRLDGLSVAGKEAFEGDTLLAVSRFSTVVDLFSALSGQLAVKELIIKDPRILAKVLPDSTANWDIMIESGGEVADTSTSESGDFGAALESVVISGGVLKYQDATLLMDASIHGLDFTLSGDLSAKTTNLTFQTLVESVSVQYDGVKYVNGAQFGLDAELKADLEKMHFTFLENELSLNGLALGVDGSVDIKELAYLSLIHI
jgi:uncharacterized protein involved in outer membrane biogenesis